jgi:hypothetical protein
VPGLVLSSKNEICLRRRLRLLDKSMKENHPLPPVYIEQDTCDSISFKTDANLMQPVTQGATHRHSDGPAVLDRPDVFPNRAAI